MVQKSAKRGAAGPSARRGRPRAYDPEAALARAMEAFWKAGFSGTSLDDLTAATGMNRPSLYGAFGDKHALYLKALAAYREGGRAALAKALDPAWPLREGLARVYALALDLYFAEGRAALGCFLIGTATTEAALDPEARALLRNSLRDFDRAFETRLRRAREQGELPRGADPAVLARLASAVLHSLAVRSRAGDPRPELEATARAAVELICGRRTKSGRKPGD